MGLIPIAAFVLTLSLMPGPGKGKPGPLQRLWALLGTQIGTSETDIQGDDDEEDDFEEDEDEAEIAGATPSLRKMRKEARKKARRLAKKKRKKKKRKGRRQRGGVDTHWVDDLDTGDKGLDEDVDRAMAHLGGASDDEDQALWNKRRDSDDNTKTSLGIGGLGGSGSLEGGEMTHRSHRVEKRSKGKAQGSIPQKIARQTLDSIQSKAQYCYAKELKEHPQLRGKITANFTVQAGGEVSRARIQSNMGHAETEECILRLVQRLKFPPNPWREPAPLEYSWRFAGQQ